MRLEYSKHLGSTSAGSSSQRSSVSIDCSQHRIGCDEKARLLAPIKIDYRIFAIMTKTPVAK